MAVIGKMPIDCPQCGKKAEAIESEEEIPHFGKILITAMNCPKCGYRLNDVMCLDIKAPKEYSASIRNEKDQRIKVVKSSSATVKIPELGVTIEPGPIAQGYITNVEGVLDRVEAVVLLAINSKEEGEANEKALAEKELRRVQDARNGKFPFTIKILDPFGNSALIGKGMKSRALKETELKKLKKNIEIISL